MKIIFVRHGETYRNNDRTLQDQIKGELTEAGIKQAEKLAKRLANEKFDFIYCSDAKRTKQTAEKILKFHRDTLTIFTPELRERNVGDLVGESYEKYEKELKKSGKHMLDWSPGGGESIKTLLTRTRGFVEKLHKKHRNQNLLLITHGGIIRSLRDIGTGRKLTELKEALNENKRLEERNLGQIQNCAVGIIKFVKDVPKLVLYNCTKHLK